ncbi:MAG: AraC family transcriptional regulator ligand-binding domain-containing protein [Cyanobacteria bacterium P01_F01_bin.143]
MNSTKKFIIEPGWQIIFKDLSISLPEILTRAQFPTDFFSRSKTTVTSTEYFQFWQGLAATVKDPAFPVRLGQAIPVESFNPPFFAALCSPNLLVGMKRLSDYKKLIGPAGLVVRENPASVTLKIAALSFDETIPGFFAATELVFLVHLIRLATREHIVPLKIEIQEKLDCERAYTDFFGIVPQQGHQNQITFSLKDARQPFLTKNDSMWQFFEPELRKRLHELELDATFRDRVHSSLLELLPTGESSIENVANKLGISKRTLQRRLKDESTSFQNILNQTRERLALYYLKNSCISGSEISFLLGYDDPNSFVRAFQTWTGTTPESFRKKKHP